MELSEDRVNRVRDVLGSYWAINRITAKHAEQNALSLGLSLQQMAILNILYGRPGSTVDDLKKEIIHINRSHFGKCGRISSRQIS